MCSYHTTRFCGACGACQRERLGRWQEQLADATKLASKPADRSSGATSRMLPHTVRRGR